VEKHGNLPVVLDCRNVHELDFTAARGLGDLHKELRSKNIPLLLMGPIPEVKIVLKGAVASSIRDVFTENELDAVLHGNFLSRYSIRTIEPNCQSILRIHFRHNRIKRRYLTITEQNFHRHRSGQPRCRQYKQDHQVLNGR
jgi:STAS domain